jgi:hypothetical protein
VFLSTALFTCNRLNGKYTYRFLATTMRNYGGFRKCADRSTDGADCKLLEEVNWGQSHERGEVQFRLLSLVSPSWCHMFARSEISECVVRYNSIFKVSVAGDYSVAHVCLRNVVNALDFTSLYPTTRGGGGGGEY